MIMNASIRNAFVLAVGLHLGLALLGDFNANLKARDVMSATDQPSVSVLIRHVPASPPEKETKSPESLSLSDMAEPKLLKPKPKPRQVPLQQRVIADPIAVAVAPNPEKSKAANPAMAMEERLSEVPPEDLTAKIVEPFDIEVVEKVNEPTGDPVASLAIVDAVLLSQEAHSGENEVDAYIAGIVEILQANQIYPRKARKKGWEGESVLSVAISAEGKLLAQRIETSSGYETLDNAALKTLVAAGPFPPFPPNFPLNTLEAEIPFEFALR